MKKIIEIRDDLILVLKEEAKREKRSPKLQLEYIIEKYLEGVKAHKTKGK